MVQALLPGRDPQQPKRTQRFMAWVGDPLGSLMRAGILFLTGAQTWGLQGLLFSGHGGPAASLGFTGDFYLDLDAGVLYKKV